MKGEENITLWDIFRVMAKIGTFTIGGGYAMILIIQKELTSRGWIDGEEFPDLVALAQAAPGLLAVNISIFAGFRMRGIPGAVAATLGSCLGPFLIILAIALFFSGYADNTHVQRVFSGMRPAVVALIAVPMIDMARKGCKKWWQWIILIAAAAAVALLNVSPIYILSVTIVTGLGLSLAIQKRREGKEK